MQRILIVAGLVLGILAFVLDLTNGSLGTLGPGGFAGAGVGLVAAGIL